MRSIWATPNFLCLVKRRYILLSCSYKIVSFKTKICLNGRILKKKKSYFIPIKKQVRATNTNISQQVPVLN